jgi:cellulose synthase/poly-beta-1,6-N-acetylglucosamine synthase-like glycosyltransferase
MLFPLIFIIIILDVYLTVATLYLLVLAAAYFLVPEPKSIKSTKLKSFAILIPAHNEELLISRLCESLLEINYPRELYEIYIIADNCNDRTSEICSTFAVNVLTRNDTAHIGKGFAISWALDQNIIDKFDAVLIVDADNVVDPFVLEELNMMINQGELAIQCHNAVGNRRDSWFTQLLFVSRTVGNILYHHSKYKLGLSSYLMGNGICFSTNLLHRKKWTAFSIGEDWEYYAQLIEDGIKVGFAVKAKVYHQESRSLHQATTQRLRWSSGRFYVLREYGFKLFWEGLIRRDLLILDASLPLIFPNYSLQINLTILTIILSFILPSSVIKVVLLATGLCLFIGQVALFMMGIYLAKSYKEVFKAIIHAPFFLLWKAIIDFLSFTRIYRGDKWVRTERHVFYDRPRSKNNKS